MITVKDVHWNYKKFSLSIEELTLDKGITILVGNNGSGKSTLLHLLSTAKKPLSGGIYYDNDTIDTNLALVRSKIGFVPTGLELYQDFTPLKLMMYMSQLKGIAKSFAQLQTKKLFKIFHLNDVSNQKIKKLSQGMQQRLALAQAFLGKPQYIFLDEPLNYLDIHERKCLLNYVSSLSSQCVILVATHELNEWENVCNSVLWMYQGKILFHKRKEWWKQNLPTNVWTGEIQDEKYDDFSNKHLIVYAGRMRNKLIVRCASHEQPAPHFTLTLPTMEDTFFIRKHYHLRS
ncbi:ATP-binding cassette domain-containing protein [Sutcliffiella halmapala]|uniref:ATP-binding cassette domain-containing protein n=1 Tax=Sutcliffiella halmapala TaxID=79882 RepID=UPI0009957247|nr:ABC transporter ATP-binding protein [Sutcliffiella halmapala]